jgi:hypothetical protein
MYTSDKTVQNVKDDMSANVDVDGNITDSQILQWINEVEQLIYTDIIKEFAVFEGSVTMPYTPDATENTIKFHFEDIYKLYVFGKEFSKVSPNSIFDDGFYRSDKAIQICPEYDGTVDLKVIYFARPAVKTATTDKISLPVEWYKLIQTYCKAMAYQAFNEFTIANNWLAFYNAYLQDFMAWVTKNRENFGL